MSFLHCTNQRFYTEEEQILGGIHESPLESPCMLTGILVIHILR